MKTLSIHSWANKEIQRLYIHIKEWKQSNLNAQKLNLCKNTGVMNILTTQKKIKFILRKNVENSCVNWLLSLCYHTSKYFSLSRLSVVLYTGKGSSFMWLMQKLNATFIYCFCLVQFIYLLFHSHFRIWKKKARKRAVK